MFHGRNFEASSRTTLLLFQIMGIYPISVRRNGYSFSWLSFETIYALILYLVMFSGNTFLALRIFEGYRSGHVTWNTWMHRMTFLSNNALVPILGFISTKSFVRYLEGWRIVEDEFLSLVGKPLSFPELRLISPVFILTIVLEALYILNQFVYGTRLSAIDMVLQFVSDLWLISLAAMWHIQTRLITATFKKLGDNFATMLWSRRRIDATAVRKYKLLYFRITSLTVSFEKSINFVTTSSFISCCTGLVFSVYWLMHAPIFTGNTVRVPPNYSIFFGIVFCLTLLLDICNAGEKIAVVGGSEFAEKMCALTPQLPSASRSEFQLLMDTVYLQQPQPAIAGCVKLNISLFTAGVNIIVAYVVVLWQLIDTIKGLASAGFNIMLAYVVVLLQFKYVLE